MTRILTDLAERTVDRRGFLKGAAAAGLVLGLPLRAAHADDEVAPAHPAGDPLEVAIARMEAYAQPGVVVVVPTDAARAEAVLEDMTVLLGGQREGGACLQESPKPTPEEPVLRVLRRAVFVCLPEARVRERMGAESAAAGAVLIDGGGKVVDRLPARATLYKEGFADTFTAFLDGRDGARLAAGAETQWEALGDDAATVRDALASLDADAYADREAATRTLGGFGPRVSAIVLVARADAGSLEAGRRLDAILLGAPAGKETRALPFGVAWEESWVDPCPPCGMAAGPAQVRRFLKMVTKR